MQSPKVEASLLRYCIAASGGGLEKLGRQRRQNSKIYRFTVLAYSVLHDCISTAFIREADGLATNQLSSERLTRA